MSRLYKNIVILTGAGISAESGLATFRSSNGLWNNHRVEDVATVEGFQRNPALVHDFYNELKIEIQKAKPNPAHLAITKLQKEYPGTVSVITQNVDTLHEKAGNTNICHIHGQINQAVCLNCGHILETFGDVDTETTCPQCGISGMMKPNIVFFGENLLGMDKVEQLLQNCDLFISVGTSGVVFPPQPLCRQSNTMAPTPGNLHSNQPPTTITSTTISTARPDKPCPRSSIISSENPALRTDFRYKSCSKRTALSLGIKRTSLPLRTK